MSFTTKVFHAPLRSRWFRLSIILLVLLTLAGMVTKPAHAAGNTYYVNCSASSNGNGSQGSPWNTLSSVNATNFQPGDRLLFHSGSTCSGQLHPGGSGNSSATITIGTDGSGTARIDGNGVANGTVLLSNQQYWDISNLEITNTASGGSALTGVNIVAQDSGTISHIHLSNLQVHNVTGGTSSYNVGGIVFVVNGSTTPTHFDDLLVQGCTVHDTTSFGIMTWTSWSYNLASTFGSAPYTPATNVRFQQNTIYNTGGDGISLFGESGGLAQNNVVHDTGQNQNGIGIEINDADNTTAQFNEVYHAASSPDGEAFDCDVSSHNCTVQYNYSHDNSQGFILLEGGESHNPIVRYNISQNDGRGIIDFAPFYGTFEDAQIYNNTFYVSSSLSTNIVNTYGQNHTGNSFTMTNNIIENLGSGGYNYPSDTSGSWDHNLLYGTHPSNEPSDANKLTSDPLFANPGGAGTGISTASAYQLQSGSPALGSGTAISNAGSQDFFGNAIASPPNRGAYQGQGVGGSNQGNNLVQNPGFETGSLSSWNAYSGTSITTSNVHSGSYAVKEPQANADLEQVVNGLSPNTTYTLTAYAQVATSGEGVYIGVKNYGGSEQDAYITSTSYTQGTVTFTTGASNTSAVVYLYKASGSGAAYGDDFSLTSSSGGGASNLVQNPGFEAGSLSSWNAYAGTSITTSNVHSGSYAVKEPQASSDLEQVVNGLSPNTTYTLTAYAEVATSGEGVYIGVKNYGGSEQDAYITSTSYTQGSVTFTTGSSNTSAVIYLYKASGSGAAYGDDFSLT